MITLRRSCSRLLGRCLRMIAPPFFLKQRIIFRTALRGVFSRLLMLHISLRADSDSRMQQLSLIQLKCGAKEEAATFAPRLVRAGGSPTRTVHNDVRSRSLRISWLSPSMHD